MASEFRPFRLSAPRIGPRRPDRPRPVPLDASVINRRKQIARQLLQQITPLSTSLNQLTPEQLKTVFLKIEHEGRIDLTGTGLKLIKETTETVSLAIPRSNSLAPLENKVRSFGDSTPNQFDMLPNGTLVGHLKTIDWGDPKDRLSPDLKKRYRDLTRRSYLIYEIEILTVKQGSSQQKQELARIRTEISQFLKTDPYGALFEFADSKGSCRAVLRSSGVTFKALVEDSKWQTKIVSFDARPKFETFFEVFNKYEQGKLGPVQSPDASAPVVCIIDSGVSIGNPFLRAVAKEDLLKSFLKKAPMDPSDEHGHGSGVSSLASYYALDISEGAINKGKVWVASARILDENNFSEEDKDGDEGRLFSEVIREAVEVFVPLGVRVFNLSVNDERRQWSLDNKKTVSRSSWVARIIDYLSKKHDIVFVVSTGNISRDEVRSFIGAGKGYPSYLLEPTTKVLDPGQAALALTVGSLAHSNTVAGPNMAGDSALAEQAFPSPFTRTGPGISGEIKPELVERGGNYVLTSNEGITTNIGTDVLMAGKDLSPALAHRSGTSFAAPRVAHSIALILRELVEQGVTPSAPLLRAFAVNSASYGNDSIVNRFLTQLEAERSEEWLNIFGHGIPDSQRAIRADQYSAVLYHQGLIGPDKVAFLNIPVPKELARAELGTKRLTVTLAFAPEVQRWGLERYLGTTLKWRLFRGDIDRESVIDSMSVEDETDDEYRSSLEQELQFFPGVNLRSRGTLQHAVHDWTAHEESYSTHNYTLALATYERWSSPGNREIPYAVVVRLEDLTQSCQVYSLVQSLIEVRV